MLIVLTQIVLIVSFAITFYQDLNDRKVYWFLFPIIGLCAGVLYFTNTLPELFLISVFYNLSFVFILFSVILLYTKFKLKTSFKNVIGLGDVLLFLALIFGCATISFMVLLPSALIFSLALHLLLSKKQVHKTVPLAGYMSLFFGVAFLGFWFGVIDSIYHI